jgi:phosphotransferase system  glucose/maltose/N-acetylglucosamine-specific IIC component
MKYLAFYLGLGTLFTHELDSMLNHEWRVIPIIRLLPDEIGLIVFVSAHIPLFALLIALASSNNLKTRRMTRIGVGVFLVLHGLLHILFKGHPDYEFSSMLSNVLIFGGSILGIIYLILEWSGKRRYAT